MDYQPRLLELARRWLLIAAAALALAASACSGESQPTAGVTGQLDATGNRTAVDVLDLTPAEGVPGRDYSPDVIEVGYLAGAVLPARLAGGPVPDQAAAAKPNAILRKNSSYCVITDAIAGRYNLCIRNQVYIGHLNIASFNLPAGVDGAVVLTLLRSEFADVLEFAGYTPLAHAAFTPDDPDFSASSNLSGPQWGQWKINCQAAWDYTRGAEHVLVGVVDTGCRLSHEELDGQVLVPEVYFPTHHLDIYNDDNTVEDSDGHGTKISGLIVAKTDNARTIAGVADGCRVIPVKISDTASSALYTDMATGCLLAAELGARVVNLSWTGTSQSVALKNMIEELVDQGVLLVVAAGNDGLAVDVYPARYPGCLAVGATDSSDVRLDFSNWGDYVDIAAPGHELRSCHYQGISLYRICEGTSFASPLVAAGAALLWTEAPTLTLAGLRQLLETTGAATYLFDETHIVRRLDLAAALAGVLTIDVPPLEQLVHRDNITLVATVSRPVVGIRLLINGELLYSLAEEPWIFDLDLSSYGYTLLDVVLEARDAAGITAEVHYEMLVDNTTGIHVLNETFDDEVQLVYPLDPRDYSDALLTGLKQLDPGEWDLDDIRQGGPPDWKLAIAGTDGSYAYRLARPGHPYGHRRTELLATPCLNLKGMVDAEFSFATRHNFADGDVAHLVYTTDSGQTFAVFEDVGNPVQLSGYQADYLEYNLDLSSLLGEKVHFVFLFESDGAEAGIEPTEDASWWLDDITLSGTIVSIDGVNVEMPEVPGTITGATSLTVTPTNPLNVTKVKYWLDYAPLGTEDDYDVVLENASAPFGASFDLTPALSWTNQAALLRVAPVGFSEFQGEAVIVPVYVFNHLGDVNADGVVDAADADAYDGKVGLNRYAEGYSPLLDADLDGVITEYDANYVGYLYGSGGER